MDRTTGCRSISRRRSVRESRSCHRSTMRAAPSTATRSPGVKEMSKCSVRSGLNFRRLYCTLFCPKYCADAGASSIATNSVHSSICRAENRIRIKSLARVITQKAFPAIVAACADAGRRTSLRAVMLTGWCEEVGPALLRGWRTADGARDRQSRQACCFDPLEQGEHPLLGGRSRERGCYRFAVRDGSADRGIERVARGGSQIGRHLRGWINVRQERADGALVLLLDVLARHVVVNGPHRERPPAKIHHLAVALGSQLAQSLRRLYCANLVGVQRRGQRWHRGVRHCALLGVEHEYRVAAGRLIVADGVGGEPLDAADSVAGQNVEAR